MCVSTLHKCCAPAILSGNGRYGIKGDPTISFSKEHTVCCLCHTSLHALLLLFLSPFSMLIIILDF